MYVPPGGISPDVLSSIKFPSDFRLDPAIANYYDRTYPQEVDRVAIVVDREVDSTVGTLAKRMHFQLGLPDHLNASRPFMKSASGTCTQDSLVTDATEAVLAIAEQYEAIDSSVPSDIRTPFSRRCQSIEAPEMSSEAHEHEDLPVFPLLLFSLNAETMRVWIHNPSTVLPSTIEGDTHLPFFTSLGSTLGAMQPCITAIYTSLLFST